MRTKGLMASALAGAVLFGMTMAAPSWAAPTPCTGVIVGGEIKGGISVEKECVLQRVAVKGSVTVNSGGRLSIEEGTTVKGNVTGGGEIFIGGATVEGDVVVSPAGSLFTGGTDLITGNVQSTGAGIIRLEGATSIGGSVRLTGTTEEQNIVSGGTVTGNVEIDDGIVFAIVQNETVDGNVRMLNNETHHLHLGEGGPSYLEVQSSTVGGSVEIADNQLNSFVSNNLGVRHTSIAHELLVYSNTLTANLGGDFLVIEADRVGDNAEVLNNTSIRGESPNLLTAVLENEVTNSLICTGNKPAPNDLEQPNTAKKKLGQCALL